MRGILILSLSFIFLALPAFASTLDGYNRAKLADENYTKMHGNKIFDSAKDDPELFAVMKKYIYGDLSNQIKLTDTERQLITIVVLTTNQNYKFLKRAVEGSLALNVKPIEIREALYHVAPYIGFPRTLNALRIANEVFNERKK